jgi:hypothetical protein
MKKIIFLSLIATAIIISACQEEYNPFEGSPSPVTGDFRAKVDGTQFIADSAAGASRMGGVIVLTGVNNSGKRILLRVADSGVHQYSFNRESMDNVGVYAESSSANPNAFATNQFETGDIYGTLNIAAIDTVAKKMSGTFSIRVRRMMDNTEKTITEGVFNNLSYATQPPAQSGTDTFRVKINGTAFTYNLLTGIKTFGMISVSAGNANGSGGTPSVGLTFPETVAPGTFEFGNFEYIGQYNPTGTLFMEADTGRVTILEHNTTTKRIRGNFHFSADTVFTGPPTPNILLNEGYFSIKYN